jgi:hypothetical protein
MKNYSFSLLAFLALALLGLAPRPAQAQWKLDHYECSGTYSINGVSTPWPTPTQSVSFSYSSGNATLQCVGTVQAFFKWMGTAPAPSTLNVLITSNASAYGTGPDPDDGFHDLIVAGYSRVSSGSHLVQVSNPNNTTMVSVPAYSLSAITTGGINVSFQGTVVNAVLQGYSTHVSPALTGSEPTLSVWDPAHAKYFSGTGCEAKAIAVPLTGYLSHVQLCINDTVVQEYWDSAAPGKPSPLPTDGSIITGTNLTSATVKALFDSTHFADSSAITIKLKVTDSNNGYYEATVAGPAYNKAVALVNNNTDFNLDENPNEIATFLTNQNNYTATPSTSMQKMDILTTLPSLTALYIDSHGNLGKVGDCDAAPLSSDYFYLFPGNATTDNDDVNQPTINKKVRDKTLAQPPFNFVFLNACLTSGDSQLANAFLGYTGSKTDRAELGFTISIWGDSNLTNYTKALWASLLSGRTVRDAIIDVDCTSTPVNGVAPDGKIHLDNENPVAVPKCYGDASMRLHYVYGGHTQFNGIFSTEQWFRGI